MSLRRIGALILRHLFGWRRNVYQLTDLFYWPLVDLLTFGFLATFISQRAGFPAIIGLILGALILWDVFFRAQQGISVSFLAEMWSRNLVNLFVSPLSLREFMTAMMIFGLIKIIIPMTLTTTIALIVYHFNVFTLGLALVPLLAALIIFSWAVGTVITGILLRFGMSAESIAWSLAFFFSPFGAVYFPLSVYPEWLQRIIWWLPLPHIFEGMREVLQGGSLDRARLLWAFGLDAVYLVLAFAFFGYMFRLALRQGSLLKAHE